MADTPDTPDVPDLPDTGEEPQTAAGGADAAAGEQPQAAAPKRPRKAKSSAAEAAEESVAAEVAEEIVAEAVAEEVVAQEVIAAEVVAAELVAEEVIAAELVAAEAAESPRAKPEVPGAHLEIDIVPEGVDPLGREQPADPYASAYEEDDEDAATDESEADAQELAQTIVSAAIDLGAGARYRATGKRKTAVARVILRPGAGTYLINGRPLDEYFPRVTLQRNISQPLEAVGYEERMDVVARMHGGGVSSQAGALRHGISKALLEADPNLRGELKRRGFLTRDSRVKERKKAGLKKARKRPQFSKR
jgi:small subunit ribosomal protein S9